MSVDIKETNSRSESRVLGDEWENWEFEINEPCESSRVRFLSVLGIFSILLAGTIILLAYLVQPRFAQFHPYLDRGILLVAVIVALQFPIAFISISLTSRYNRLPLLPGIIRVFHWMAPGALWIGGKFGMSRDRLYNSFIKVHNGLVKAGVFPSGPSGKTIILLPRCLKMMVKKNLKNLAEKNNIEVYTVGGGEAARKIVKKEKPTAIVAVACERDLVAGIRDIAGGIPVIGIPNVRPEGPCKNTLVDLDQVEGAVNKFI
ncbi:DUF116 domain-containing protein [Acidobacteriota bacterium]